MHRVYLLFNSSRTENCKHSKRLHYFKFDKVLHSKNPTENKRHVTVSLIKENEREQFQMKSKKETGKVA